MWLVEAMKVIWPKFSLSPSLSLVKSEFRAEVILRQMPQLTRLRHTKSETQQFPSIPKKNLVFCPYILVKVMRQSKWRTANLAKWTIKRGPAHKKWCHTQAFVMGKVSQMETDSWCYFVSLYMICFSLFFHLICRNIFQFIFLYISVILKSRQDQAQTQVHNHIQVKDHIFRRIGTLPQIKWSWSWTRTWVWVWSCPYSSTITLLFMLFIKCKFDGLQQVTFLNKLVM